MLITRMTTFAVLFFMLLGHAVPVSAQTYRWKGVATSRSSPHFVLFTSLATELEARTKGQVTLEMVSLPELGLTGFELARVARAGLVDVADVNPNYVGGDVPVVEGVDLPGLYPDFETSVKAHSAFMPAFKKYQDKMGGLVLGAYLWPQQVVFSRKPIRGPADLKGLKIRVSGAAGSEFVRALGAEPVSLPLAEVYTAIERGTVDAALSGTSTGGSLKWYEVSKYLVDVNHGPLVGTLVVSKTSWDKLKPELQATLVKLGEEFTEKGVDIGRRTTREWIEKNREQGMEWIPITPVMAAAVRAAAKNAVVPNWVKRTGADAKPIFNQYLAPYAGFTIP